MTVELDTQPGFRFFRACPRIAVVVCSSLSIGLLPLHSLQTDDEV